MKYWIMLLLRLCYCVTSVALEQRQLFVSIIRITSPLATYLMAIDSIFSLLKENKFREAYDYVLANKLSPIDSTDEHGTTVLQYAAFRGLNDLCELLLKRGADVNAKTHDQ